MKLTVHFGKISELGAYWQTLGKLVSEGYTSGTLMDGWNITGEEETGDDE
jgi:hypothetical protein